jgi:hypothetical protein
MKTSAYLIAGLASVLPAIAMASCGSAFCTVNSNWTAESALAEASSSFDVRYEYIDQNQPLAGSKRVAVGQVPADHDEVSTVNRNLMTSFSHNFGSGWGLTVSAPVGQRDHVHVHNEEGEQREEQWKFTELGDVRVLGRYQLSGVENPLKPATGGLLFGLKLPTGSFNVSNAEGEAAERSLQPGTGTTDLILGGYHHEKDVAQDSSWFIQGQIQHALNRRRGFKPGAVFSADLGYRQGIGENLGLMAQLNFLHKRPDRGEEAEPADSGGRFLFLSPGLSYALPGNLQAYAFYQHPLYRHVTGVQLTAARSLVIGVSGHM